jgi:hypothetical protein
LILTTEGNPAMTDTLSAADKAKLYFKRATDFVAAVIASWPALAISTLCLVAFGAQSYFAPERLPPFGGLSLAQVGLPSAPDLGELNNPLRDATEAAQRQAREAIAEREAAGELSFFEANPQAARIANLVGFGASAIMLLITMTLQRRRFR